MLLTEITKPGHHERIYAVRTGSVIAWFEDDGEGGTQLAVEPGEFACPYSTTQAKLDAVRLSVLLEAAQRLNCPVEKVSCRSMAELSLVVDAPLAEHHAWYGQKRTRGSR